jgi:hypothetical protein
MWLLLSLGGFWLISSLVLGWRMRAGDFRPIQALHQDLGPEAPPAVWWAKNVALGGIGILLVAGAFVPGVVPLAALAIALEQLAMPLCTPRRWKSYSGALVGLVLAGAVQWAGGAWPPRPLLLLDAARFLSGLFAGGLLLIATLPTSRAEVVTMVPRAERIMPQLARAIGLCLVGLLVWSGRPALWVAAAALASVFAISLAINVPINRRLATHSDDDRRRWYTAHFVRTGAGLVLLGALLS